MEIKIKNVAKVKKADIVINGVTVIAGYNGTGKSTVCKSLYSMCNSFGKLNLSVKKARRSSIYSCVNEWEQSQHSDENAFFYSDLADKFLPEIDKVQIKLESMTYEDVSKILNLCNVKAEEDSIQELFIQLKRVIDRPLEEYAKFIIEQNFSECFSGQINTIGRNEKSEILLQYNKLEAVVKFEKNKLVNNTYAQLNMCEPMYIETYSYLDALMSRRRRKIGKIPFYAIYEEQPELTFEEYDKREEGKKLCEQIINDVTHGQLKTQPNREMTYK